MNLHVSHPKLSVDFDFGVEEIRASIVVVLSSVDDLQFGSIGSVESAERKKAMLPNVMKKAFHRGEKCGFQRAKVLFFLEILVGYGADLLEMLVFRDDFD